MAQLEGHERRVIEAIRDEAGEALDRDAARLTTTTVRELYGSDSPYDALVVVLDPANPRAARLVIEVQDAEQWWLSAADGPPYEFYPGMKGHFQCLRRLVEAVVAGDYEQRPAREWVESVFHTSQGTVVSANRDPRYDLSERRTFEPY